MGNDSHHSTILSCQTLSLELWEQDISHTYSFAELLSTLTAFTLNLLASFLCNLSEHLFSQIFINYSITWSSRWLSWLERLPSSTQVLWRLLVQNTLMSTECWDLGPQVCSDLPTKWEQTSAAKGSLALKAPIFLSLRRRQTCDFKHHQFSQISLSRIIKYSNAFLS